MLPVPDADVMMREATGVIGRAWSIVVASLLAGGCYLSHGRAEPDGSAHVDGRPPSDASECGEADFRVAASLVTTVARIPGLGSLVVTDRDDEQLFRDGHTDHRFDLCFSATRGPFDLSFVQEGGPNYFPGETRDFTGTVWGRFERHRLVREPLIVRLERRRPDSVFLAHLLPWSVTTLTEDRTETECRGSLSACRVRFIELGADGESLLGAGQLEVDGGEGVEVTLESDDTGVGSVSFTVELPGFGELASLALEEVRPLDCSYDEVGELPVGSLDTWRCTYAGVGTVEEESDGVARGRLVFSEGPAIRADTVMARLGSADAGLEAYVFAPCCATSPTLRFGDVQSLEVSGSDVTDLRVRVQASDYDHGFVDIYDFPRQHHRVWGRDRAARWEIEPADLPPWLREQAPPFHEVWVGAISTVGEEAPWEGGAPRIQVRRRLETREP